MALAGPAAAAVPVAALEELVACVTYCLDADVGEGVQPEDSAWVASHAELIGVARRCAGVLDPVVVEVLSQHTAT